MTFEEAAKHGELVALCTRWKRHRATCRSSPARRTSPARCVIDATNPLKEVDGRPVGLERGWDDSGGEQVQRWLPDAKVVKAFNIVGNALMVDPKLPGGPPTMLIAGNDDGAKKHGDRHPHRLRLGDDRPRRHRGARVLEPMCWAWVLSAMRTRQVDAGLQDAARMSTRRSRSFAATASGPRSAPPRSRS